MLSFHYKEALYGLIWATKYRWFSSTLGNKDSRILMRDCLTGVSLYSLPGNFEHGITASCLNHLLLLLDVRYTKVYTWVVTVRCQLSL